MILKLFASAMVSVAAGSWRAEEKMPRPLISGPIEELKMGPLPIEPSWVIAGNPEARASLHSMAYDEQATTAVWDCTAGTFRWYFGWDETVVILEGEVHVTGEDGSERTLKAGDIAYFPGNSWAVWQIDNYVRKIAFCRREIPAAITMAFRLKGRLREIVRGTRSPAGSIAA